MNFLYYSLLLLFLVLSFFLILLVLIQKGRGGGLSAAFGGVGGNTAFGAKTGDVLTWATSIVFGVFLLLAIGLNLIANHVDEQNRKVLIDKPTTAPAVDATMNTSPLVAPPVDDKAMMPPTTKPTTNPTAALPPASDAPVAASEVVAKKLVDAVHSTTAPTTQPGH